MSMTNSSAFLLGPAISGVIIITFGATFCIVFNAISFFICALFIFLLPDVNQGSNLTREPVGLKMLMKDFQVVYKFAVSSASFISIYVLFQCAMLIGYALDSQEATFIKLHLELSDTDYGNILSITGFGSIVGGFVAAVISKRISYRWFLSIGSLLVTFFYIMFYGSFNFITASLSFLFLGFSMSFAGAGYATFFQKNVPTDLMGRFASIVDVIQGMIQIMITLLVGFLSDLFSLQLACIVFGSMSLFISLVLCKKVFSDGETVSS